ncbi:glutamine synthetase type I [Halalkalibacter wakoensis JCM 9140]|uniref:Glutamine synthetase type I n=1 Tax=Halalkalibacter wakoensis JCM 9140 TaxID=1236970 RepID=W4Q534_9BACI|nr:glutamine synthetase type I [Halalkalibacter wakoensis JCM 9140]
MSKDELDARGIENLPTSLEAALERFATGEIGKQTFGEHAFNEYVALKQAECDDYRLAVTDWEVAAYQSKF